MQHMKFKDSCKDEEHLAMAKNLHDRIGDMDLYRLMYHDYEPYVQIAAEKFGTAQLRKLAVKVAELIEDHERYTVMSKLEF